VQVGTGPKTSRAMNFVCDTPSSVKLNVPLSRSRNVNVPLPTWVRVTLAGSKGSALNAGPAVSIKVPL
jgi:hypothetical protein